MFLTLHLIIIDGQVSAIMKRFLKAVISYQSRYIVWPVGREKMQIIEDHKRKSGFTGCVGFIDGSLLDLTEKPMYEPQNFFNRKQRFMVSSTMVCDYNLKIMYAQVGDYGKVHDARALREGDLAQNASKLFSPDQFILGDGAYPMKSWILPVKRNHHKKPLTGSDIKFNKCISKMRVRIENCFAALKGRFPSVDSLRVKIRTEEDVRRVNERVLVCCILHNFCLENDNNRSLEYFSSVFFKKYTTVLDKIRRMAHADYIESLIDENEEIVEVPDDNVLDESDAHGKAVWNHQKHIVLEEHLKKNIEELDKIHEDRHLTVDNSNTR